jgi:predicted nucleotidyltransferase
MRQDIANRNLIDFLIKLTNYGKEDNVILGGTYVLETLYNLKYAANDIDIFIDKPTFRQRELIHVLTSTKSYIGGMYYSGTETSKGYYEFDRNCMVNFVFIEKGEPTDLSLANIKVKTHGLYVNIKMFQPRDIINFKRKLNRRKDIEFFKRDGVTLTNLDSSSDVQYKTITPRISHDISNDLPF